MTKLHIAPNLSLPLDFVTSRQGIVATSGMGKSHLAQVQAEELLELGQVVIVIDPTDSWYGLRSSADGKHDGYPIAVFGGDHGVLKLEEDAGRKIAEAVVTERFSCVLCTEGLTESGEVRFVREFLSTLYRLNRDPLHVFIDEADLFAPQTPRDQEDSKSTRAMSSVVRRGRKKGIGCTMITQRPSELHKGVLSQADMLMVLGMAHNLDIEAVEKWMRLRKKKRGDDAAFALQEEMIESLSSLPQGDAWVWAPRSKLHKRFRAREKRTFDSGATPKPGQRVRVAKKLAPVDIKRLGAAIAEAVERQKADDPKVLRARVVDLEKQLAKKMEGKVKTETVIEKVGPNKAVVADLERSIKGAEKLLDRTGKRAAQFSEAGALARACCGDLVDASTKLQEKMNELIGVMSATSQPRAPMKPVAPTIKIPPRERVAAPPINGHTAATTIGGGLRRILVALAQRPSGLTNRQIGLRAGLSSKSGTFSTYLRGARQAGWIEDRGETRLITEQGIGALGSFEPLPTGVELQRYWLGELGGGAARILQVLIDAYPAQLDNATIGERANISPGSGTFSTYISRMRGLELITGGRGATAASEELFS
jgi:hypothetical protein